MSSKRTLLGLACYIIKIYLVFMRSSFLLRESQGQLLPFYHLSSSVTSVRKGSVSSNPPSCFPFSSSLSSFRSQLPYSSTTRFLDSLKVKCWEETNYAQLPPSGGSHLMKLDKSLTYLVIFSLVWT